MLVPKTKQKWFSEILTIVTPIVNGNCAHSPDFQRNNNFFADYGPLHGHTPVIKFNLVQLQNCQNPDTLVYILKWLKHLEISLFVSLDVFN